MSTPSKALDHATPIVRQMDFVFGDDLPTFWFGGDVFKTLLLTAQSLTFPEGERFFIQAVRYYQDRITDPVLKKAVRAFIGQEAHHGREHDALNQFMESRGFPILERAAFVKRGLAFRQKYMRRERQLAMTCALEHFTAMFAEIVLEQPEFLDGMDERVKALWVWHAVEESEHKAVAFDVFKATVNNEWIRNSQMVLTTMEYLLFSTLHHRKLLRHSPQKVSAESRKAGLAMLFGKRGLLRQFAPRYLAYFKKDFHPNQTDSRALRAEALRWLAAQHPLPKAA